MWNDVEKTNVREFCWNLTSKTAIPKFSESPYHQIGLTIYFLSNKLYHHHTIPYKDRTNEIKTIWIERREHLHCWPFMSRGNLTSFSETANTFPVCTLSYVDYRWGKVNNTVYLITLLMTLLATFIRCHRRITTCTFCDPYCVCDIGKFRRFGWL